MSTQEKGTALSQKVADAAKSISNVPHIDDPVDFIEERLAFLGIYGEEDHEILISQDCTEGDARCVFCEGEPPVLPVPRFKRVWRILKGSDASAKTGEVLLGDYPSQGFSPMIKYGSEITSKPIGQWKDIELLEAYRSMDCESDVFDVLDKRSKGRSFIIFEDEENGIIDIDETLKVLRLARRQETPETYLTSKGVVKRLYPVGHFPYEFRTECPLHDDTILFGGYCDKCKSNWRDIDYERLQFARLVSDNDEGPDKPKDIKAFMEDLRDCHSIHDLSDDYPEAYMEYCERNMEECPLPILKKKVSSSPSVNDPIFGNKNKRY
jgi:hypothetical protein